MVRSLAPGSLSSSADRAVLAATARPGMAQCRDKRQPPRWEVAGGHSNVQGCRLRSRRDHGHTLRPRAAMLAPNVAVVGAGRNLGRPFSSLLSIPVAPLSHEWALRWSRAIASNRSTLPRQATTCVWCVHNPSGELPHEEGPPYQVQGASWVSHEVQMSVETLVGIDAGSKDLVVALKALRQCSRSSAQETCSTIPITPS